ncbi:PLD nuclease N-terminal domain-containing protein [Auritidibacter ignavus]|uniref:PLD nuclease N-terminal domain-containing protein n=1 Tax=Auritidibacter ignavus TaxID=678932 RepID=UPI00109D36CD|nr:PLD nuclease N-terminal domain-containing protein [Auritidibacter ignavus]
MRFLIPLAIVALGVMIYAFVECMQTPRERIRTLAKPAWLVIIALVPAVGALLWLFFGHRRTLPQPGSLGSSPQRGKQQPARPKSPDDDDEFLRRLDIQRRQKAREEQLDAREAKLDAYERKLRERHDSAHTNDSSETPDDPDDEDFPGDSTGSQRS